MSNDDARFEPPQEGGGWLAPAERTPAPTWGSAPQGGQMWDGAEKSNWLARHKMVGGVAAGLVGLSMLVGVGVFAEKFVGSPPAAQAVAAPPPIMDVETADDEVVAKPQPTAGDKTAAKKAAASSKGSAEKLAAEKAAARKKAAEKRATAKRAAAERKAARQRATLPKDTDCDLLGDEAVRISRESKLKVKVTKVHDLEVYQDNRKTFAFPAGSENELVLSCHGLAATSDGLDNVPIAVRLVVDAKGEYYVVYRGR